MSIIWYENHTSINQLEIVEMEMVTITVKEMINEQREITSINQSILNGE